ncbi:MAG: DUF4321 domain-containing protein [Bacillota bacterium]
MKGRTRNPWLLLILLAVGIVLGGLIGEIFQDSVSFLKYGKSIGVETFTIDLSILKITLGFMIQLNIASIIGILLAILIFYRL